MAEPLAPDVETFILEHISSVVQLESLLLLYGAADRDWDAESLSRELRIDMDASAAQLADLHEQGFLQTDAGRRFRYAPTSVELRRGVEMLAKAYQDRRVAVISLIYSKPSDTIRVFADAFRIRKGD